MDTLHVVLSDTHAGSNKALFLGRDWAGMNGNNHTPTSAQVMIREKFLAYADAVKTMRNKKRVRVIVNGDCIEGFHHSQVDVCSTNPLEQSNIHIEIMQEFQKLIGWQRGDEIYYTTGTEVHTGDWEDYIGHEMNAVLDGGLWGAWNYLELETNGKLSIFSHHGPAAGSGANEGNNVRNWLRMIYFDRLKDNDRVPDMVYTGHVHSPTWAAYEYRKDGYNFSQMHGTILPSWQVKTRYAYMRSPVSRNVIGGVIQEVKSDGTICVPVFVV